MKKRCTLCKRCRGLAFFNKHPRSADGLQTACRTCNRAYARKWYRANKKKHMRYVSAYKVKIREESAIRLVAYLREHPCVICGERDPLVLEFDHVKRSKINVTELTAALWPRILKEIQKCQVLCANCHSRETHRRANSKRYKLVMRAALDG